MEIATNNRLLTISEAAEMLHYHVNTVRRWSDKGLLKPYRVGSRSDRRFNKADVISLIKSPTYGYK